MSIADAVTRETQWLASSAEPGLPALLQADGGPFGLIQAYDARTPQTRVSAIHVLRPRVTQIRFAQQRKINRHDFRLKLLWPIGSTSTREGMWETEQAAFDAAVQLVVDRIAGFVGEKTHGGRFMSVAEAPDSTVIQVTFGDPAQARGGVLEAQITYSADDVDHVA